MSIPHVLILGGGFGGLSAANEIRKSFPASQVNITIIDKKDWFMVGFAKLWIIQGVRTFDNSIGSLTELSKKDIKFVKDDIQKIDLKNRKVHTNNNDFNYDYLIVALGTSLVPEKIPGLVQNGFNLYGHEELVKIREKLTSMKSGKVAISIMGMPYKCPPAPFEACLLIDSLLRENNTRDSIQIHMYSPAPITLPAAGPEVSERVLEMINSDQIEFHPNCKVISVEANKLKFENGEDDFDLLLAVPPHVAPKVIYDSGLAKENGFIVIDRDCKTPFENVYAVGDVTTLPVGEKMAVPKAGIFAEGEGITVAKNIIAKIQSREESAKFDGRGGCFLESGKGTASLIEVDMFAEPKPSTKLTESTIEHKNEKLQFEKERLQNWL